MKIIFASDIHESYRNLLKLFQLTDADLYIIAGDLIYSAFPSWAMASRYTELQQFIISWGMSHSIDGDHDQIVMSISQDPAASDVEKAQADEFWSMGNLAHRTMLKKYERIGRIFALSEKNNIITIPGNYDMNLSRTALKQWDLHKRSMQIDGLKISGYGGARVFTPGIPQNLQVSFEERFEEKKLLSEPYQFFSRENPDIILVHHPPYGYLDQLDLYGSIGSIGIRDFIDQSDVHIILSGHMHEDWGAIYKDSKMFINPSNFGRVVEIRRVKKGGYFAEIFVEGKEFIGGSLRQIEGDRIFDIERSVMKQKKFRLLVMDLKRYRYLANIKKREKHIRAIRIFNALRTFFQKYETDATHLRIQALLAFVESLKNEGHEIAFHLLGSLNFGMAEETSDIDAVLYFRNPNLDVPDDVSYPVPHYVSEKLDNLKEQGLMLSICDCLNLVKIEEAIQREDVNSLLLQRFVFYNTTCRCINGGLIKEVEHMLREKEELRYQVENELEQYFRIMIGSFRHIYSLKKYQTRLKQKGMKVPPYIEELIWQYLQHTAGEFKKKHHPVAE